MKKMIEVINNSELNKRQIALKAGVDTAVIYNIVNGKKKDITLSTASKLADALEVSLDELREEKLYE